SGRHAGAAYDERFRTLLQQSEQQAQGLSAVLRQGQAELAARNLSELEKACAGCHVEYRN
ncbi:MAG: cytochrome c, partial [Planctomycetaceae bacterium]